MQWMKQTSKSSRRRRRSRRSFATVKDALRTLRMVECALSMMEQRRSIATMKDALRPKNAQNGGVCIEHGATKKARKSCSSEGCTKQAQNGGVCIEHGARKKARKLCNSEGRSN
jgi:hypothetical protein